MTFFGNIFFKKRLAPIAHDPGLPNGRPQQCVTLDFHFPVSLPCRADDHPFLQSGPTSLSERKAAGIKKAPLSAERGA